MKQSRLLMAATAAVLASCSNPASPELKLAWSDEFDGPAGALPNAANWKFDVGTDWGNAQLEYDSNLPTNASLDGVGNLRITARRESSNNRAYTSARITTQGLRETKYGRYEARMKLPTGRGMWPAFWLLGANIGTVGWPQSGEIDIMENRGQEPTRINGSLHGPGYSGGAAITRAYDLPTGQRVDNEFHVYKVEWTEDRIDYFVDDSLYQSIKKTYVPTTWVFDHPFYIILNLAVGGNYVGAPDASTVFPQSLVVDYVRVYR